VTKKTVLDLFSGIGGFSRGFERAGFKTIQFCEIDEDCRQVLKNHWPAVPIAEDIKKLSLPEGFADVITGGFPCQNLSHAGKQEGLNAESSGLWWEMRRVISEVRPKFAVMENVSAFLSGERGAWFGDFLWSLAEIGYAAQWHCVTAAAVGQTHLRERTWIVAYPHGVVRDGDSIFARILLAGDRQKRALRQTGGSFEMFRRSLELLPKNLRMDDGLPVELDEIKSRVKMLGNSIVPEIAYLIAEQLSFET